MNPHDDLFSDKNAAKVPAGQRGAFHVNRERDLGGRMKWKNLLAACCPKCGYKLISGEKHANVTSGRVMANGTLLCENPHCSFAITSGKMNGILADMSAPGRDVDDNLSYLNNI